MFTGQKSTFSFTPLLLFFFFRVASANPTHRSRHCQHKNEPRAIYAIGDCSKSWITVRRRLPFKQLQQAPKQNYDNDSQHVVIYIILYCCLINSFIITRMYKKDCPLCKLNIWHIIQFCLIVVNTLENLLFF